MRIQAFQRLVKPRRYISLSVYTAARGPRQLTSVHFVVVFLKYDFAAMELDHFPIRSSYG